MKAQEQTTGVEGVVASSCFVTVRELTIRKNKMEFVAQLGLQVYKSDGVRECVGSTLLQL